MNPDDQRLITDCLAGHKAAFGELVRRYQDRLYNLVYRILDGNSDDAADVLQETFLSAYQSLESFKGNAEFYTWLYRIAFNMAISHKRRRHIVFSLDPGRNGESASEPPDISDCNQPGDALERHEEESRLQAALNRLSPEHRIVLILKDLEDQKYETIAETLGVPIGTIRSRLHRARLELRQILGYDTPEE